LDNKDVRFNTNTNKSIDDSYNAQDTLYSHDSIKYTKDIKKNSNYIVNYIVNTIESCTSSEIRHDMKIYDESSFISKGNQMLQNLNIDIK
jgi:hypothetical protein